MTLCECGCGQPTEIAKKTNARSGHVAGQHYRFVRGHHGRTSRYRAPLIEDRGYRTPCSIWQGAVIAGGYGWDGDDYAHRTAWRRANGRIPRGRHIDHLCEVRLCVNPEHLEAVTQSENNRRTWARGRRQPAGCCVKGWRHLRQSQPEERASGKDRVASG